MHVCCIGGPTGCYTVTHDEEELRMRDDEEMQEDDDDDESNDELERNISKSSCSYFNNAINS